MKKVIALALTAAMVTPCIAVRAEDTSRVDRINSIITDGEEINILYNDIIINFDDVKPINKDGRVMIPFNAVLEDMGATVKYDELKREVTAEKGDTTINFTLMDDTINVNKNGNKSTITMDVPMIIVEDRTLVPIRFMSDAFSMQIGWDGASETVIILDYNEYFDNLDNIAPNLTKMMSMKQPEFNKEYLNFGFAANIAETEYSISGKVDGTYADKTTGANVTVNVSKNNNEIKDSFINVVVQNGMCYFKTDLITKMAATFDDVNIKTAALAINSDSWYKVDLDKLIDGIDAIPAEIKSALKTVMAMSNGKTFDMSEILKGMVDTSGDAKLETAFMLAAEMDTYEQMDKFVSVTEKENGGYSLKMDIKDADFDTMISNLLGSMVSEEDKKEVCDIINYNLNMNSECDGVKVASEASFDFGVKIDDGEMKMTFTMEDTAEKDDSIKAEQIPENSTDITDIVIEMLK